MNLNNIVAPVISAVNPQTKALLSISAGYATLDDGTRVPSYHTPKRIFAQVQALTGKDLKQLDSLNLQGSTRAIYCNGNIEGVVRAHDKGGDLITFGHEVWLTTAVLEAWADWTKFAVVLQNGA